jgi:hypothetical protein
MLKNKKIFIIFLIVVIIILFLFFFYNKQKEPYKISVCPTFYNFLNNNLDNEEFLVILTSSTSESLDLLEKKEVDYALGGRVLKPDEKKFNYHIIGEGLSFLSFASLTIYDYDLSRYPIFTDLDIQNIEDLFGKLDIQVVDNVYDYLEKGLIITSWDNTDYSRAEVAHLLRVDGSRNLYSRLPIVYCSKNCPDNVIEKIKKTL